MALEFEASDIIASTTFLAENEVYSKNDKSLDENSSQLDVDVPFESIVESQAIVDKQLIVKNESQIPPTEALKPVAENNSTRFENNHPSVKVPIVKVSILDKSSSTIDASLHRINEPQNEPRNTLDKNIKKTIETPTVSELANAEQMQQRKSYFSALTSIFSFHFWSMRKKDLKNNRPAENKHEAKQRRLGSIG